MASLWAGERSPSQWCLHSYCFWAGGVSPAIGQPLEASLIPVAPWEGDCHHCLFTAGRAGCTGILRPSVMLQAHGPSGDVWAQWLRVLASSVSFGHICNSRVCVLQRTRNSEPLGAGGKPRGHLVQSCKCDTRIPPAEARPRSVDPARSLLGDGAGAVFGMDEAERGGKKLY